MATIVTSDSQDETTPLSSDEQRRVDELLSAARRFHNTSFVAAGLGLALSAVDNIESVSLPLGEISLPKIQASIGLYFIVIAMTLTSDRYLRMAVPWIKHDQRRPPFAWAALGKGKLSGTPVTLWLLLPVVLIAISSAIILEGDVTGTVLVFAGVGTVILPRTIDEYTWLIRERTDHRGGPATLSIYLLYWYRLARQISGTLLFFVSAMAAVPKWRESLLRIDVYIIGFFAVIVFVRQIGGLKFIYRRIDRIGGRFGFTVESKNY